MSTATALKADARFADEKTYLIDEYDGALFRRLRKPEKDEVIATVKVNGLDQQYRFAQVATIDSEAKPEKAPGPEVTATNTDSYGYCPKCGERAKLRERRPNGNDICINYHVYPSADALTRTEMEAEFGVNV